MKIVCCVCAVGTAVFEGLSSVAEGGTGFPELEKTRLKGYLGDRLDAMIARQVSRADIDYITAPFLEKTERRNWWQTEFWGKWMHAAMPYLAYAESADLRRAIDRGIDRILLSQEPCGYIGNYPNERRCGEGWDVWGMKYALMGLLHYYDGRVRTPGEPRRDRSSRPTAEDALDAAKRLCDYVIGEIGPNGKRGRELWQTGNWSGMASSSLLEPVVWLYKRTNERKYLEFAAYIVKGMTEPEKGPRLLDLAQRGISVADRNGSDDIVDPEGGYVMKHNRWKAYEMMSCYQGLLEYYEVTGRRDLLDAAIATAEDIVQEEVNLAGGCSCSEAWFHGARKQHLPYVHLQETCVTTTWMRFCEKLLDVTGDPKWADQIERTFYNAYLAAMKRDGSAFASYTPLTGSRSIGQHHCRMHTNCCMANGPRGFLCFLRKFFVRDKGRATFNFYGSALVDGFDAYSLYPRENSVRIVSHTDGPLKLRLRIPVWSAHTGVRVNGEQQSGVSAGAYFEIDREWKLGDVVEIAFDMPVMAHVMDHHLAFTRGPVLLARDSRFADGEMTEPIRGGIADGQSIPSISAVRVPSDGMWMAFSGVLPIGAHWENPEGANPAVVSFCDFASAGSDWNRTSCYRTWFPIERGPNE